MLNTGAGSGGDRILAAHGAVQSMDEQKYMRKNADSHSDDVVVNERMGKTSKSMIIRGIG